MCLCSQPHGECLFFCPSTYILITSDKRDLAKINQYNSRKEIKSGQMNQKMQLKQLKINLQPLILFCTNVRESFCARI